MPRAFTRTGSAAGSQHCVALRVPALGLAPPNTVTHAVAPSGEMTEATGSTPSATERSVVPLSASRTISLSSAGRGSTATRCPSAPARAAMAGPPAMKSPNGPDSVTMAAVESAA